MGGAFLSSPYFPESRALRHLRLEIPLWRVDFPKKGVSPSLA
jgi:hypothetical protein